jgi:hypothetical protein
MFSKKTPGAHPENLEKISKPIVGHWKNFTTHPAIHEYVQYIWQLMYT